ncbi:MAG: glutathione S-transferase N-terminal domain-containing protein [Myxococcota bacterium]
MIRPLDVATSITATLIRLASGVGVGPLGARPERPLELYEFEGCPYCRKVREGLTILDLDAIIHPCPKGGPRYREEVKRRGGKYQFPYLVDPNTGKEMYESDEILRYLFAQYGAGRVPMLLAAGWLGDLNAMLAGLPRPGIGVFYRASTPPAAPVELYSFEASPFCRLVREALSSLEIPYHLHNVGKGSPRRDEFVQRSGKMMVPYLVDPNTDSALFESAEIVRYLERTYAAGSEALR